MTRHPHPHVSVASGKGYVILMVGPTQITVSLAEAGAIAAALNAAADDSLDTRAAAARWAQ